MYEVEVKFKLQDRERFIESFKSTGGKYKAHLEHTDIYYNMPSGMRSFGDTDEALRLRKNKQKYVDKDNGEPKKTKQTFDFTYKGPKLDDDIKTRKEYVCHVSEPEELQNILKILGFEEALTVKKSRELLEIKFNGIMIECVVDRIQYLEDTYCEFEIQIEQDDSLDEAKQTLFALMKKLGYGPSDSIQLSYMELIMEKLEKQKK